MPFGNCAGVCAPAFTFALFEKLLFRYWQLFIAPPLAAMPAQPTSSATPKKNKPENSAHSDNSEKSDNFLQKVGFRRVRYAHTAPPTPAQKWASPFFGFAHPPPDKRVHNEIIKKICIPHFFPKKHYLSTCKSSIKMSYNTPNKTPIMTAQKCALFRILSRCYSVIFKAFTPPPPLIVR